VTQRRLKGRLRSKFSLLRPGYGDLEPLGFLDHRLAVCFAEVLIPEWVPNVVAALDLDHRAAPTAVLALTLGLVVDATCAD
jgi:hypothetical protein